MSFYQKIGSSDISFSKVILGTWQGGKDAFKNISDKEIIEAIQISIESGITSIDTAPIYGNGYSEKLVAQAVKKIDRSKFQVATKVFPGKLKKETVIKECEMSLKNLNMDYIDLYQIHWPAGSFKTEKTPIAETLEAFNYLKDQGKIKVIRVSNFNKEQIIEAQKYAQIDSNQPPYNLTWRPYDTEANPYCRENNISILAYSPLAQGVLTGKFKPDHAFEKGDVRGKLKTLKQSNYSKIIPLLDYLNELAQKYNCKMSHIALLWVINQKNTFAIAGARNKEQALLNAQTAEIAITQEEIAKLTKISNEITALIDQNGMMWEW